MREYRAASMFASLDASAYLQGDNLCKDLEEVADKYLAF
jgi:hypothetical protein